MLKKLWEIQQVPGQYGKLEYIIVMSRMDPEAYGFFSIQDQTQPSSNVSKLVRCSGIAVEVRLTSGDFLIF
jgi:hypothetical protein